MKNFAGGKWVGILVFSIVLVIVVFMGKNKSENVLATPEAQESEQSNSYLADVLQTDEGEYNWSAVVMDAKSGEIIDSFGDIQRGYEPSSTFKAIPAAILLEKSSLNLSDLFLGDAYAYEDNKVMRSFRNQDGEKTFLEHFKNLNEPLMLRAWQEKGSDLVLQEELQSFLTPIRYLPDNGSEQLYLLGNGFEVNVLDMAKAYFHLAGNGEDISEKMISVDTSGEVRELLHETYLNYTNIYPELASIQNIGEIAGIYGSTYSMEESYSKVTASFAGFAPYDDPQVIVVITLERVGEMDAISDNTNTLATTATKIFEHYLPSTIVE